MAEARYPGFCALVRGRDCRNRTVRPGPATGWSQSRRRAPTCFWAASHVEASPRPFRTHGTSRRTWVGDAIIRYSSKTETASLVLSAAAIAKRYRDVHVVSQVQRSRSTALSEAHEDPLPQLRYRGGLHSGLSPSALYFPPTFVTRLPYSAEELQPSI